ncbi:uncharacterized protein LOC113002876 isoform X2 [Solenopsis invicta]|uniref:uncharacterized protein LOC113002876 isoform X2 n=1 Tax=Solenopsis invicta TaxID=13686 RepID=UPI00193D49F3|nr:uncharacterized protein LOC113002876 isoform X2 [Solenopsis invicta]
MYLLLFALSRLSDFLGDGRMFERRFGQYTLLREIVNTRHYTKNSSVYFDRRIGSLLVISANGSYFSSWTLKVLLYLVLALALAQDETKGYGHFEHSSIPISIYGAPTSLPEVTHFSLQPNLGLGLSFAHLLNTFLTIAKLILNFVILKTIIKFIAVMCSVYDFF